MTKARTRVAYQTSLGAAYESAIEDFADSRYGQELHGQVKLVVTSPPFPLLKPKEYGNHQGEEYLEWIASVFEKVASWLRPDGSLVVEIGNAWERGQPSMSTLPLRSLMKIAESCGLSVCQQFICNNPARLPGPAQWVTVNRYRVKDSYTHVWWFAKDPWVSADNRRVRQPYSPSMKKLLARQSYNSGTRPSAHKINDTSFLADNGGAIPSNALSFANTSDSREYVSWCRSLDLKAHPARMPRGLVEFFVDYLSDEGDLVADCFGGSNTVGIAAQQAGRRWISVERDPNYLVGSMGRFSRRQDRVLAHNLPYRDYLRVLPG